MRIRSLRCRPVDSDPARRRPRRRLARLARTARRRRVRREGDAPFSGAPPTTSPGRRRSPARGTPRPSSGATAFSSRPASKKVGPPTARRRGCCCVSTGAAEPSCGRRRCISAKLEKLHRLNSRASSTPATDGKHVFVTFLDASEDKDPRVIVGCYDFDGKQVWQKSPGRFSSVHGFCSSPILYKDMVIVNCDHDGDGYVVALAKADGGQRWRIDRPNKTRSYCAPLMVDAAGKKQTGPERQQVRRQLRPGHRQAVVDHRRADRAVRGQPGLPGRRAVPDRRLPDLSLHGHQSRRRRECDDDEGRSGTTRSPTRARGLYVPSPIAVGKWFFVVADDGW